MESINKEDIYFSITKDCDIIVNSQNIEFKHLDAFQRALIQLFQLCPADMLVFYLVTDLFYREQRMGLLKSRMKAIE